VIIKKRGLAPFSSFEKGACPLFLIFEKSSLSPFSRILLNKKTKKGTGIFFQKTKKAACPLFGILSLTIKK